VLTEYSLEPTKSRLLHVAGGESCEIVVAKARKAWPRDHGLTLSIVMDRPAERPEAASIANPPLAFARFVP